MGDQMRLMRQLKGSLRNVAVISTAILLMVGDAEGQPIGPDWIEEGLPPIFSHSSAHDSATKSAMGDWRLGERCGDRARSRGSRARPH